MCMLLPQKGEAFLLDENRLYRSPVLLGQGHAGVAEAGFLDTFFYNPAMSTYHVSEPPPFVPDVVCTEIKKNGKVKKNNTCPLKTKLENPVSNDYVLALSLPFLEISKSTFELIKLKKNQDHLNFIRKNVGVPLFLHEGALLLMDSAFGKIALLQDAQVSALTSNDLLNEGIETAQIDFVKTLALSLNKFIKDGDFSYGFNFHFISRGRFSFKEPITDVAALKKAKDVFKTKNGYGLGLDLGLRYDFSKTRFSLSGTNIGDVKIKKALHKGENLNTMKQSIDIGVSQHFDLMLKNVVSVDFRDLMNRQKNSMFVKSHFGHKVYLFTPLYLNWGLNQGYFSYGAGYVGKRMSLVLAHYFEEIGKTAGFRQDERYVFNVEIKW